MNMDSQWRKPQELDVDLFLGTDVIRSPILIKALRVLMGTAVFKRSSLQIGRFLV